MANTIPTTDVTDYGNEPGTGPLRPGGRSMSAVMKERDLPSTRSKAAEAQLEDLHLVRDTFGGTRRMKDKGYLPQERGERPDNYRARVKRSVFFNAFKRSVEGLVGLVFNSDPVLGEDVPEPIVQHWENIDNAGTHGAVFARELLTDAMVAGHAAILVEYPKTGGQQTRADEQRIRPYWVPIRKEDIMSWRTEVVDGVTRLSQVVIRETVNLPDGLFGEEQQVRYRVLYRDPNQPLPIRWALLEVTKDRRIVLLDQGGYGNQTEIPLAEVVTSGRRGMLESEPPFLDLAHMNIAHFQAWSDYATAIHMTNVPLLFGAGLEIRDEDGNPIELIVGPNTAILEKDPQARLEYVSHNGAALGSSKAALDDLKSDMGSLALQALSPQKRVAETAEAKRMDKASSDSALSVMARGLQDALERALGFHANYLRLPDGGSIEINRDFEGLVMDPAVMSAYAELGHKLGLPPDVILRELQAGGRIPEDADIEELELRMLGMAAADAEMQEEARQ